MQTAVIVGTGLLGSSFGLAARRAGLFGRIIGVSSPPVAAGALAVHAIDEVLDLAPALAEADFVLLAQPVRRILSLLGEIEPLVKPGALITDVGSTKVAICAAGAAITRATFIGGHPMAGREVRGPEGALATLFENRPWILTAPHAGLEEMVRSLGAQPVQLNPADHDRLVALSSHLPQLAATALASLLSENDLRQVAGPGILDMTRLALSSFPLWEDILSTNRDNIDAALAAYIGELEAVRAALRSGTLQPHFERGARLASQLRRA
ncbi:MAG: prephenate dehydrogenase [Acidobacteriota bacterium]